MKRQWLDFGLNVGLLLLLLLDSTHAAETYIATAPERPTLSVDVRFDGQGEALLAVDGVSGPLGSMTSRLVAACAVPVPPVIVLGFEADTLLRSALEVAQTLNRVDGLACPVRLR